MCKNTMHCEIISDVISDRVKSDHLPKYHKFLDLVKKSIFPPYPPWIFILNFEHFEPRYLDKLFIFCFMKYFSVDST